MKSSLFERRFVGLALAAVGLLLLGSAHVQGATLRAGLTPDHSLLLGLAWLAVCAWVFEIIPPAATGLLIPPALVLLGLASPRAAFAGFADPLLFVFVGAFMLTRAMVKFGLDARLAGALLRAPKVQGRPVLLLAMLACSAWLISMWVSNTATCAALLPLVARLERRDAPSLYPYLLIAYATTIGGMVTPVGTPPNLIILRYLEGAGVELSFFDWIARALPASLGLMAVLFGLLLPKCHDWSSARITPSGETRRPWRLGERVALAALTAAVVGWLAPSFLAQWQEGFPIDLAARLHPGVVALVVVLPIFFLRDPDSPERKRLLPAQEAFSIDWAVIFLFGGGIVLGGQVLDSGLAERLIQLSLPVLMPAGDGGGWSGPLTLAVGLVALTLVLTELCSNTATAAILGPIALPLAVALSLPTSGLGLAIALSASCAFALPVATGPNAIIFAADVVKPAVMLRVGTLLNLAAVVLISLALFLGLLGRT